MSKKFEIINDKWIKDLQELEPFENKKIPQLSDKDKRIFKALRLSSVNSVSSNQVLTKYRKEKDYEWSISLHGQGNGIAFYYELSEKEQYEQDLKFLSDLLFNR